MKSKTTEELLGCSISFFCKYVLNSLKKRMIPDNYGLWVLDHIIPLSSFNLSKEEEQLKAFNYKNIQPLWAEENLKKGAKLNWQSGTN